MNTLHQIKLLISEGKLEDGIRLLIEFAKSNESGFLNECLALQGNLKRMTSRNRLFNQRIDEATVIAGSLELADEMEKESKGEALSDPESRRFKLAKQLELCQAVVADKKSRYTKLFGFFILLLLGTLTATVVWMSEGSQLIGYAGTVTIGIFNVYPAREILGSSTDLTLISRLRDNLQVFEYDFVETTIQKLLSK